MPKSSAGREIGGTIWGTALGGQGRPWASFAGNRWGALFNDLVGSFVSYLVVAIGRYGRHMQRPS